MARQHEWPDGTVTLTAENFDRTVADYETVLVYMWAEACAPCKEFKPKLETLADDWQDEVVIGTLKTDDEPALSKRNRSLKGRLIGRLSSDMDGPSPTFVLYENGERTARTWGFDAEYARDGRELEYIREWVNEHRSTPAAV